MIPPRLCCPSSRVIVMVNGLKLPAWEESVPARKVGVNGRADGQASPEPLASTSKDDEALAVCPP